MGVPVVAVDPALPTVVAPRQGPASAFDPEALPAAELDRQLRSYAELGVLDVLGLDPAALAEHIAPLRELASRLPTDGAWATQSDDAVAFVLVLPGLHSNAVVPAMRRAAKAGVSVIPDDELATYRPIADLEQPAAPYLLTGIDTGTDLTGVTPEAALVEITGRGRTPLTLAEGIALATLRPDMLRSNRCWSLAGSRTGTNQRVPAVWISERRAKLGWCWDRNPHTWLGTASAAGRVTG